MGGRRGNISAASRRRKLGRRSRPHLDDVEELVPVDAAVSVHVVELEVPAQLVLHLSPHHQAERGHVLHEVDVAVLQNQEVLLDQMRIQKGKPLQDVGLSPGPV